MSLPPPENESLVAQVNSSKEASDDKQGKASVVHACFQAGSDACVKAGQCMAAVAATLGVVEQTLYNCVKADWVHRPIRERPFPFSRARRTHLQRDVSPPVFDCHETQRLIDGLSIRRALEIRHAGAARIGIAEYCGGRGSAKASPPMQRQHRNAVLIPQRTPASRTSPQADGKPLRYCARPEQ